MLVNCFFMKRTFYSMLTLLACAIGLLAGCTKNESPDWVDVDKVTVTLDAAGETAVIIAVESSTSWTATPSASWVQVAVEATTLSVTAEPNEAVADRTADLVIQAGSANITIKVVQVRCETQTAYYRSMTDMQGATISPSGKFVGAYTARVDKGGQIEWEVYLIDLATNEKKLLATLPYSLYQFDGVRAVTDEGIVLMDHDMIQTVLMKEGEADYMLPGFEDVEDIRIAATSAGDGSVWVGYATGPTGMVPVKYVHGVPERMEMPKTNFRGQEVGNVVVRGCSADGSMAYGSTWDNLDFGMLYWDKDGHVHWAGEDIYQVEPTEMIGPMGEPYTDYLVTGLQVQAEAFNMSPNGRYIGGLYYKEEVNADRTDVVITQIAAVYDTEEHKTIILSDYSGYGGVTAVTDDGLALISQSMQSYYCQTDVVNLATGENLGDGIDYVMDKFGLVLPASHGLTYLPIGGQAAFGEEAAPGNNLMWYWYVVAR